MGVFAKCTKDLLYREDDPESVTLAELREVLQKVDYYADGNLDRLEFVLLALDRSLVFQKEYLQQLYQIYSLRGDGEVRVKNQIYRLIESPDTSEQEDWFKKCTLKEQLVECNIVGDIDVDDQISELQFLYICRDIFGLNTFDIDESLPTDDV